MGGDNCGGTGFVVYNNQIVKRKKEEVADNIVGDVV